MSAGRLYLTPIEDADSKALPHPTNQWVPIIGCAEWDGLVTLESVIGKRRLKLMFTVYPPLYGEFSISESDGSVIASGTPELIERPIISDEDRDVVDNQLRAGRYLLRCDCTTGVNYRLDIEVSNWYSID